MTGEEFVDQFVPKDREFVSGWVERFLEVEKEKNVKSECENCGHPDHGLADWLREPGDNSLSTALRNCGVPVEGALGKLPCRCMQEIQEGMGNVRAAARLTVLKDQGPAVFGKCPMGCGETLFLGSGGHVTCSVLECPDPSAVSKILEQADTDHVVEFRDDGFAAEHPLAERIEGALNACTLHSYLMSLPCAPVGPGRYRVTSGGGVWVYDRIQETKETENHDGD